MSPDPNFDLIAAPEATPAPALVQLTLAAASAQVEPAGVVTYTVVISNTLTGVQSMTGRCRMKRVGHTESWWRSGDPIPMGYRDQNHNSQVI